MVFLNESFAFQPFASKFQDFDILYDLVFHQVHLMDMYFLKKGHVFVTQNFLNQLYDFMHSFLFYFFNVI
jgi:hypothetical protein